MNNNPLAGYFRKPAIHMTLPSSGEFYPDGSLEMPVTNELPVYPMTALDEITYKTPDALFNGSAVIDVIKSCVPAIKNPWDIPVPDLSAILVNIRIASFGHSLDIDTTCPKCDEIATYGIDLRNIVDTIKSPDYSTGLNFGDLQIFLKPLSYLETNENNKQDFNKELVNNTLADKEMDEAKKLEKMSDIYTKITNRSFITLANNINYIQTPDGKVGEKEYILDFLHNCDREIVTVIKDRIVNNKEFYDIKPIGIKCDNKKCGFEYKQPFTLDMSTFFD